MNPTTKCRQDTIIFGDEETMITQWYLCEIWDSPRNEEERLSTTDNLAVTNPDSFSGWCVWLPIIPRVGDTLQFGGWQVQVSKVVVQTNWYSPTGEMDSSEVAAVISIRDNVVPYLMESQFSIDANRLEGKRISWENFARRGHDLEYYAWELRHPTFRRESEKDEVEYYRWHSRIRPIAGDIVSIQEKRWKVTGVELASANNSIDGWLTLESVQ